MVSEGMKSTLRPSSQILTWSQEGGRLGQMYVVFLGEGVTVGQMRSKEEEISLAPPFFLQPRFTEVIRAGERQLFL